MDCFYHERSSIRDGCGIFISYILNMNLTFNTQEYVISGWIFFVLLDFCARYKLFIIDWMYQRELISWVVIPFWILCWYIFFRSYVLFTRHWFMQECLWKGKKLKFYNFTIVISKILDDHACGRECNTKDQTSTLLPPMSDESI